MNVQGQGCLRLPAHFLLKLSTSSAGKKLFSCRWDGCDKKFAHSSNLSRHHQTHTVGTRFVCGVCERSFIRSDNLTKHYQTHSATKRASSRTDKTRDQGEVRCVPSSSGGKG